MLRFTDVTIEYGAGVRAVQDVSLTAETGTILAIIGGNGAGKTTLMRAASGTLGYHGGSIIGGSIELDGERISGLSPHRIVAGGLALVPEGRHVFTELTVEENLAAGGATEKQSSVREARMKAAYERFEILGRRRAQPASLLSGGEQQQLAIARGLMSGPSVLLLDEPTLGLAPQTVARIAEVLRQINEDGTTVVLVEQNAAMALGIANQGVVIERGSVSLTGSSAELRASDEIKHLYLGGSGVDEAVDDRVTTRTLGRWEK